MDEGVVAWGRGVVTAIVDNQITELLSSQFKYVPVMPLRV